MKFIDFCYDGINLSDFGFIACTFDASSGINVASAGSKITFTKSSRQRGKINTLVNTEYNDCLTATFDICKDPEVFTDPADMYITNDEQRDIMRWLNRRQFLPFKLIPDECDEEEIDTCHYNASFNIEKIKLAESLIGLRLNLETDKPFGYADEFVKVLNFQTPNSEQILYDFSDEVGETYPDLTITVGADGNLELSNETLGCTMVIKNCTSGEVITIHGNEQIIETSVDTHDICNDFNFTFIRIANTYLDRSNKLTCSLASTVKVSYRPIIKDTP